jgi:hypothetical protein
MVRRSRMRDSLTPFGTANVQEIPSTRGGTAGIVRPPRQRLLGSIGDFISSFHSFWSKSTVPLLVKTLPFRRILLNQEKRKGSIPIRIVLQEQEKQWRLNCTRKHSSFVIPFIDASLLEETVQNKASKNERYICITGSRSTRRGTWCVLQHQGYISQNKSL